MNPAGVPGAVLPAPMVSAVTPGDRAWSRMPAFRRKVEAALVLIEATSESERLGVSVSGGKDSSVTAHLVRRVDPGAPCGFFDSGCEYASTYATIAAMGGVTTYPPVVSLLDLFRYGGYWGYLESVEANIRFDFKEYQIFAPSRAFREEFGLTCIAMGLRMSESGGRKASLRKRGLRYITAYDGCGKLCPIGGWTVDDVWAYIAAHDLPYNAVYDRLTTIGVPRSEQRVSAMVGKTMAGHGRFSWLRQIEPDRWRELTTEFPMLERLT